jgi:acetylornithine deacetylase/succinyl-diaminopimelate desuccinylase-like protein
MVTGCDRSSVESLIELGFKPTRTIVLAFGFDEEVSGSQVSFLYKHGLYGFHLHFCHRVRGI